MYIEIHIDLKYSLFYYMYNSVMVYVMHYKYKQQFFSHRNKIKNIKIEMLCIFFLTKLYIHIFKVHLTSEFIIIKKRNLHCHTKFFTILHLFFFIVREKVFGELKK